MGDGGNAMRCPNCGEEMEAGRIIIGRFLVGVKWIPNKDSRGRGSSTYIRNNSPADCCPTCGIVVALPG